MRGQKLGCFGSETNGGSVQQPPMSRLFVSVDPFSTISAGNYVCAPEPWVLIVFILSPSPLPFRRFLLAAVPILFRFRFTTCLVSLNSIIPSPQAVTPSTCPILLSLYQHHSLVVWLLASNSNAATLADLRLFIMGLPSCRN